MRQITRQRLGWRCIHRFSPLRLSDILEPVAVVQENTRSEIERFAIRPLFPVA